MLGEELWQHQNAKISHLHAQNVKKETMQQAKTQQQILKELKSKNSAQSVEKEQFTKKQNNWGILCLKRKSRQKTSQKQ